MSLKDKEFDTECPYCGGSEVIYEDGVTSGCPHCHHGEVGANYSTDVVAAKEVILDYIKSRVESVQSDVDLELMVDITNEINEVFGVERRRRR